MKSFLRVLSLFCCYQAEAITNLCALNSWPILPPLDKREVWDPVHTDAFSFENTQSGDILKTKRFENGAKQKRVSVDGTFEIRPEKFVIDDVALQRSVWCLWLVVARFFFLILARKWQLMDLWRASSVVWNFSGWISEYLASVQTSPIFLREARK